jgi:putative cell wall-binding protein
MATKKKSTTKKKWSKDVTEHSDALDLETGVFAGSDPAAIARSLKRSATHSHRRKGTPYQSAMSMLNFYINRGGKNLSESKKKVLEEAKDELRKVFHRGDDN